MMATSGRTLAVTAFAVTVATSLLALALLLPSLSEVPRARPGDVVLSIELDRSELVFGQSSINASVTVRNLREHRLALGSVYYLGYSSVDNSSLKRVYKLDHLYLYIARPGYTETILRTLIDAQGLLAVFELPGDGRLEGGFQLDFRFSDELVAPPAYFSVIP